MKPYFIYKGINSRSMGISILKFPSRIRPEQRGELINVPGRDGYLFETDGAYNNKTIEMECTFLPPDGATKEEIESMIMEIPQWLDGSGQLILSDNPNYLYEARMKNAIPIDRLYKRYRRFIIQVEVQPFSKSINEIALTKITTSEETYNIKTFYKTYPILEIDATGSITININDQSLILNSLDKKITIDCEYMNATEEEGLTSVNNKVNGYPIYLKPGDNIVNVVPGTDSTFNNLVIKYRGTWI